MAHDKIKAALAKLDVNNNDHWTNDGSPRVDALGLPDIKRADITAAAPHFTRDNPVLDLPKETLEDQAKAEDEQALIDEKIAQVMEHFGAEEIQPNGEDDNGATIFQLLGKEGEVLQEGALHILEELMAAEADKPEDGADEQDEPEPEPEPEAKAEDEQAPVDDLAAARIKAMDDLAQATKVREEAQKAEDKARQKLDDIENQMEAEQRGKTTQHDIMDYIKTQNRLREQRAAQHRQFVNQGFDPSKVGPAPIDKAMARKNVRGSQRPVRPPMTKE